MLTVIIEALGKNGEAQAVALDIIKAFVILANGYGVFTRIFDLIQSSLTNCSMKAVLNSHTFHFHINAIDPPQASVLRPNLFLIFIGDHLDSLSSQRYLC